MGNSVKAAVLVLGRLGRGLRAAGMEKQKALGCGGSLRPAAQTHLSPRLPDGPLLWPSGR